MTSFYPRAWDFHCHLDLFPDPAKSFRQAEMDRICTLTMTTTPQAWWQNLEWAKQNKYVQVGLGLHPELVIDRAHEIDEFLRHLPQTKIVGEVGLDRSRNNQSSYDSQILIFERIIKECNRLGEKLVSIHSRRAEKDVLDILTRNKRSKSIHYVLHWFNGSKPQMEKAIELGCYFSINESMLQSKKTAKILEIIPLNKMLTETDEPFRTELPHQRIEQLDRCVLMLAKLTGLSKSQMTRQLRENSRKLIEH